jgi:hypothetical protein
VHKIIRFLNHSFATTAPAWTLSAAVALSHESQTHIGKTATLNLPSTRLSRAILIALQMSARARMNSGMNEQPSEASPVQSLARNCLFLPGQSTVSTTEGREIRLAAVNCEAMDVLFEAIVPSRSHRVVFGT